MADFRAAGMAEDPKVFFKRAVIFTVVIAIVVALIYIINAAIGDNKMNISMHTQSVAGGIQPGSPVILNGAQVGTVKDVSSVDGNDKRVDLQIDKSKVQDKSLLSSTMNVSYAPWNLFGISSVILQNNPGGTQLKDQSSFFPDTPNDATLTTLLRQLSDTQDKAFAPHMGTLLQQLNTATAGLMPMMGVFGKVLQNMVDTQKISAQQSLPLLAQTVTGVSQTVPALLSSVQNLMTWTAPLQPGYIDQQDAAIEAAVGPFTDQLIRLAGPEGLAQLAPVTPMFTTMLNRISETFPDASRNGLELQELVRRIRAAMPDGPNGRPVLNIDVILRGVLGGAG